MQNFKLSCLCMSPSGGLSISRPGLFIPSTSPLVGLSIARRPVFTSPETQLSISSVWPEYVSSTVSLTLMKCYRPIYEWDKECTRINNLDRCHFNPQLQSYLWPSSLFVIPSSDLNWTHEKRIFSDVALRPVVISDIQYWPMVGVELDHVTEWTLIGHDYTLNSQ